ncbi:UvrD-helicase domain-containing protein [Ihuprevotella massiliensis]|uniref:UvrD-helicase domain-containing protein n=1 Tax=Ihuprevotella massiliensis TaxID=1852368 RepID=UPI00094F1570
MNTSKLIHVYKASAGAGKTYTLAAEFIANLLNDFKTTREPHRHQLAITFTRKATTEMKERILENLYELAHCVEEQQAFLNVVRQKLLVPASDREISLMTRSLLRQILHGYDRFHVTTIDSFFQSLLSNLAHELGLTATFKVDLNNDDLLQRGVDKMLQGLEPDSQELKWVSQYIEQRLEDDSDKSWRVEHSLSNLARELTKESYVKQRRLLQNFTLDNDLAKRYRDVLHSLKKNSIEEIQQSAQDAENFIVGSEGYSRISRGGDVEKYLHRAMEYKFSTTDPSNTVLKIVDDSGKALKAADKKTGKYDSWASDLSNHLEQLLTTIDNANFTINSCDLSLQHFNELRLLDAISASVQELNTENDTFLLAYTPILFAEMVGQSEASFVFERAGTQFNHVMIDEFQDTSELQWTNLRNLFVENIAHGNSCMLVGDVKQGIYRWRGGDWSGLANIKDDAITDIQTLDSNFRSGEKIVNFNNAIFVKMAQVIADASEGGAAGEGGVLTSLYAEDLVKQNPVREGGFVRVLIEKKPEKTTSSAKNKADAIEASEDNEGETAEFSPEDDLREQIMRLYRAGVPFDKMGILVRNNKDSGKLIEYFAEYEKEHANDKDFIRIELVSDEAYVLSASRGVQLIVKALQYIHNRTDEVALNYVLKHCPEEAKDKVHGLLVEWSKQSYQMLPFYDLIQQLIHYLELDKQPGEASYLYSLLDMVVAFLDDNVPDIGRFLQVCEESLGKKSVPASVVKGVRILTIHKSKGLDFHSVFIPYCNWELVSSGQKQSMIWTSPQEVPFNEIPLLPVKLSAAAENSIYKDEYLQELRNQRIENLNLLYVAFTRARQNLVICAPKLPRNYDKSIVPALQKTITQLGWTDLIDGDVRLEEDDTQILLEIAQPSTAECIVATQTTSLEDGKPAKVVNEKKKNPFKINAITERVNLETSNHDVKFRQSQSARLYNAALMEAVQAGNAEGDAAKVSNTSELDLEFFAKREAAKRRGTLLHHLMEEIESEADVETVLQSAICEGKIAPIEEVGEMRKLLHRAMKHEIAKEWFDGTWQLYRECTILTRDENGNVHAPRPDRVMMRGDEAIVVDYKFGLPRPDYHEQVRHYCQLLQQMGKQNVKGYLWYVASGIVEPVSL